MARLIEAEVWERRPGILTGAAELVLIRLADSAGSDHRMVWIGEDTLVEDTRKDRSTVYDALYQLRALNIIRTVPETEWPAAARRYASVVRQINPVSDWAVIRKDGKDVVQDLTRTLPEWKAGSRRKKPAPNPSKQDTLDDKVDHWHESDGRPDGIEVSLHDYLGMTLQEYGTWAMSGSPTDAQPDTEPVYPTGSVGFPGTNQKQNQEQEKEETPSLPSRSSATKHSRAKPADDEGLDPADGLFDLPNPEPQRKTGRRQPGPDTGLGLVAYFEASLSATTAGRKALLSPDPINRAALAGTLNRWKKSGTTPDQIRAWMITYADSCGSRTAGAPPWRDFLYRRASLATRSAEQDEHSIRHDPTHPEFAAYWGLSPEEAAALVAPLDAA